MLSDLSLLTTFASTLEGPVKHLIDYLAHDPHGGLSRYAFICKATCNIYRSFIKTLSNTLTFGQYQWRLTKTKLDEYVYLNHHSTRQEESRYPQRVALDNQGNLYFTYVGTGQLTKDVAWGKDCIYSLRSRYPNITDRGVCSSSLPPPGITVDHAGNVYVTEYHKVYKITPTGDPTVIAGDGTSGNFSVTAIR